jgi:hypothetical protein
VCPARDAEWRTAFDAMLREHLLVAREDAHGVIHVDYRSLGSTDSLMNDFKNNPRKYMNVRIF